MPPSMMQLTYCAMMDRLESCTPFGRDSLVRSCTSAAADRHRRRSPPAAGRQGAPPKRRRSPNRAAPAVPPGRSSRVPRRPCRPRRALSRGRMQRILHDESGGARVLEDKRDLVGAEHEVDRHHHGPQARKRKVEHRVLPAVVRQQGHPLSLFDRAAGQGARGSGSRPRRTPRSSTGPHLIRAPASPDARSADRRSRSAMPCTRACCTSGDASRSSSMTRARTGTRRRRCVLLRFIRETKPGGFVARCVT